jgi:hypothetical protein
MTNVIQVVMTRVDRIDEVFYFEANEAEVSQLRFTEKQGKQHLEELVKAQYDLSNPTSVDHGQSSQVLKELTVLKRVK